MSTRRRSLAPEHYESLRLRAASRLAAWTVALGTTLSGIGVGALLERTTTTAVAAGVLLTVGGIAIVAAYRLSTHETVVTRLGVTIGWGVFSRTLARWEIESVSSRSATGWRRLYARNEVVIVTPERAERPLLVPCDDPRALAAALASGS